MKRTVFAYPYVVFAIIFLLAPLLLIVWYSVTLPVKPLSVSTTREITVPEIVEQLDYIGYKQDNTLAKRATYTYDDTTVTVHIHHTTRDEVYRITVTDGIVSEIAELYEDGTIDIDYNSITFNNVRTGFSLTMEHFQKFFSSPVYINTLLRSLKIALISTIFCLVLGYPTAFVLAKMKTSMRDFLSTLFILPMWMNALLRTYAWRSLLEKNGIINTLLEAIGLPPQEMMYSQSAVILCMVYNFIPYMIMPIYNTIGKLDNSLLEASHDLGANHYRTLFKVVMPLSLPGVISGITMTFIPSVTAFTISEILGGTESAMIGSIIHREFSNNYWFGSAMSVIIMVLLLISMAFLSGDKEESPHGSFL